MSDPDDPLTDAEVEQALIAIVEAIERGGCPLGMIYVRDKDDGGMTLIAHYSNAGARQAIGGSVRADEARVEKVAEAIWRSCGFGNTPSEVWEDRNPDLIGPYREMARAAIAALLNPSAE